MSKNLVMSFLNEGGKLASIRLNSVKDAVTELEVKDAMDLIISKNIFSTKGGDLKVKDSAAVVNTESTELFVK
jgi:hypothetical protein